jgi:ribosome-associated translation inhibitor RaiA
MCIEQTPPTTQLILQQYNRFTQSFQKILKSIIIQQIEYTQRYKYQISLDLKQHLIRLGIHRNKRTKSITPTTRQLKQQTRLTHLRKNRKNRKRKPKPNTTHLPTLCWTNLRSLNNKTENFVGFVQDSNFDAYINCETWIEQNNTTTLNKLNNVSNYYIFSTPRSQQITISEIQRSKQGGGLMTLINKKYSSKQPIQIDLTPFISAANHLIPPADQK